MSILTNRVLLRKSDCVGVMPYHVALDDVEHGLLAILPVVVLFLAVERQIVQGLSEGAAK